MAEELDLVAEIREDTGKGSSRRLRRAGKVPAIIYGAGREPRALIFNHNDLLKAAESESFMSSVLNVKVGENVRATIIKDIQVHPAKRQIMHLDLQRIVEDEKIKMAVPLHYLNEENAVGVKQGGGIVSKVRTEVEVSSFWGIQKIRLSKKTKQNKSTQTQSSVSTVTEPYSSFVTSLESFS